MKLRTLKVQAPCSLTRRLECNGVPGSPAHVDPRHCIAVLEPRTDAAQQWLFRRKSETYTILRTAPLAFSDCDSAISAAVHGGGYVRVLSIEAAQQVAAGLLRPVLDDWNDASEPIAVVHAGYPDASEEVLAFRTFMASIFPSHVTANCQRAGLKLLLQQRPGRSESRANRLAGFEPRQLRPTQQQEYRRQLINPAESPEMPQPLVGTIARYMNVLDRRVSVAPMWTGATVANSGLPFLRP